MRRAVRQPRLDESAAFNRKRIREASMQGSVAVQWKDGVIRRKVHFRDFEPTNALNLPKRILLPFAVGTIAPSATCLNLGMVRSGPNLDFPYPALDVSSSQQSRTPACFGLVPQADVG